MILVVALFLQAVSVFLLRHFLPTAWLRRPFPLMVLAAVLYHGLSEILMLSPDILIANISRLGVEPRDAHLAALAISGGMLSATISYLLFLGPRGRREQPDKSGLQDALRVLDWRVLLVVLVPLAAATYAGGGYASGEALDSRSQGTLQVLASQFFLVVFVLATFTFVARFGDRTVLPALAIQSLLMAAAGQRLEIIVSAVTVCVLLTVIGRGPRPRQLLVAGAIGALLIVTIGTVRATAGREVFYSNTGIAERVETVTGALLRNGVQSSAGTSYIAQAATRFDGNELSAYVMKGYEAGVEPIGFEGLGRSLELVVPSALNPNKIADDGTDVSAKGQVSNHFGRASLDTLPGHFGVFLGFVGPWGLLVLLAAFGALYARAERWVFQRFTAARLVWLTLLLLGALFYEKGLPSMFALLRYGLPLGFLVFVAQSWLPKTRNNGARRRSVVGTSSVAKNLI